MVTTAVSVWANDFLRRVGDGWRSGGGLGAAEETLEMLVDDTADEDGPELKLWTASELMTVCS